LQIHQFVSAVESISRPTAGQRSEQIKHMKQFRPATETFRFVLRCPFWDLPPFIWDRSTPYAKCGSLRFNGY